MLAGVLAVPLSGCDLLRSSTPVTPPAPTADELLVGRVTPEIRRVRDLAAATPGAESLADLHDTHLAALGSPAPATTTASPAPVSPTVAAVRAAEISLDGILTDAALRAADGGLARLLASMAAAVAQQVALMPASKGAR
jgi:hypothetical protein